MPGKNPWDHGLKILEALIEARNRLDDVFDALEGREIWAGVILSLEDAAKVLDEEIERYGTELGVCHA